MASTSTGRNRDVEAQKDVFPPYRASYHIARCHLLVLTSFGKVLGEDDIHERTNRSSEMGGEARRMSVGLAQIVILQALGTSSISPRPRISSATCHIDTVMNTRRRSC